MTFDWPACEIQMTDSGVRTKFERVGILVTCKNASWPAMVHGDHRLACSMLCCKSMVPYTTIGLQVKCLWMENFHLETPSTISEYNLGHNLVVQDDFFSMRCELCTRWEISRPTVIHGDHRSASSAQLQIYGSINHDWPAGEIMKIEGFLAGRQQWARNLLSDSLR